jgi:hypothetical protein
MYLIWPQARTKRILIWLWVHRTNRWPRHSLEMFGTV